MTPERFEEIFKDQIERCKSILASRERAYSIDSDRLHNFKQAAALQQCSPRQALLGMVSKQVVALSDAIVAEKSVTASPWTEWITDIINYMILLQALLEEEVALEKLGFRSK